MGSYSDALEKQLATIQYIDSGKAEELVSIMFRARGSDVFRNTSLTVDEQIKYYMKFFRPAVKTGKTYYWSPELCRVLEGAAAQIPDFTLTPDLLPTPSGFVIFDKPLVNGWSADLPLEGLTWIKMTDMDRRGASGVAFFALISGRSIPYAMPTVDIFWDYGKSSQDLLTLARKSKTSDPEFFGLLQIFGTMLLFLKQEILVSPETTVNRALRRRMETDTRLKLEPVVRVIELRRRVYSSHPASEHTGATEFACQWMVRGHWRQQWYPSLNRHQPKWIMPYVKGPEDKPLKPPSATVFAVVR